MIEVNLLPGGKKRSSRKFSFALPSLGGGGVGMPDPYLLFAVGAGLLSLGYMGWAFLGVGGNLEEIQVQIDDALQDSVRFADVIARNGALTSRSDSIAQRVAVIQEIDSDRYVWPHVLDEIAGALPEYTWLVSIVQTSSEPVQLLINGRAGSNNAITSFMRNLEASRFLRTVGFQRTQRAVSEQNQTDLVYEFDLDLTFEAPPLEELESVPLFDEAVSALEAVPGAVPDTVGG